jgi:hypothetical protein
MATTSHSTAVIAGRNIIWTLKASLKDEETSGTLAGTRHANSLWTCVGSSDGTTAALDGVDRWGTAVFDNTKIVSANNNAPHSWIILQNTTLAYQLLIDFNTTTQDAVRIALTPTSHPFVLAGTATHSPPATTRSFVVNSLILDNVSTGTILSSNAAAQQHASITFDQTGQFTYIIHRAGTKNSIGGLCITQMDDAPADDQNKLFFFGTGPSDWPNTYSSYGLPANSPTAQQTQNSTALVQNMGGQYFVNTGQIWVDQLVLFSWYWKVRGWHYNPLVYRGIVPDIYMVANPSSGALHPSTSAPTHIIIRQYAFPYVSTISPIMG